MYLTSGRWSWLKRPYSIVSKAGVLGASSSTVEFSRSSERAESVYTSQVGTGLLNLALGLPQCHQSWESCTDLLPNPRTFKVQYTRPWRSRTTRELFQSWWTELPRRWDSKRVVLPSKSLGGWSLYQNLNLNFIPRDSIRCKVDKRTFRLLDQPI